MSNKIIAMGLLTPDDLARLGEGFTRHFPVVHDEVFADLQARPSSRDHPPVSIELRVAAQRRHAKSGS